ncbi:hypothetical protein Patl1_37223 [Pistacia atlantica]|nr:hypothetical protein Patl1_37223 [Pistacia atlantica]
MNRQKASMTALANCPTSYYHKNKFITLTFSSSSSSSSSVILNRSFKSTAFTSRSPLSLRCFSSPHPVEDMDGGAGISLYPSHRCKTLYLVGCSRLPSFLAFARKPRHCGLMKRYIQVRHAQGIHNVDGDKNFKAYMSPEYFDAHLTQLGWQQVDNLRKHVHETGLSKRIDLVIASPLLRTLQTAVGVFGGEGYEDRMDVVPLMVANAGNSGRAAISSLNCPPVIAVELCREHLVCLALLSFSRLCIITCNLEFILVIRGETSVTISSSFLPLIFPWQIESDEDVWWKANVRETKEEVAARGLKFMNWLWTRKEKEIAIVTHSGFLFHTLTAFGNDCHPSVKAEICKQ